MFCIKKSGVAFGNYVFCLKIMCNVWSHVYEIMGSVCNHVLCLRISIDITKNDMNLI